MSLVSTLHKQLVTSNQELADSSRLLVTNSYILTTEAGGFPC